MRLWATASLLLISLSSLGAEVRVATINLKNYLVQDRRVEGQWRPEHPKPEVEKAAIRRAIAEISPDILALQEMGPGPFLLEMQRDLRAEGMDFPYAILLDAADPDRHLSVLSRIEPLEVIPHKDLDLPYQGERIPVKRGLLEVVFPGKGQGTWSLFVVHLKSRWSRVDADPESGQRRTREAWAIRDRILERYPEGEGLYLIAGDFNDHRSSAPLRRFRNRGEIAISFLVESYDSRGEKWTFYYDDQDLYERVDFFLSSERMRGFIVGGEGIVYDPLYVRRGTDHRPVFVDLDFSSE